LRIHSGRFSWRDPEKPGLEAVEIFEEPSAATMRRLFDEPGGWLQLRALKRWLPNGFYASNE
jgi:hypothetical protein